MGTYLIIAILAVVFLLALRPTIRHFQGHGGCCGGGGERKPRRKKLDGPKVAEKRISIQGMHCEACQNRVERRLNGMDGVAANISWRRHQVVVSLSRPVSDEALTAAVTGAGYQVTDIQTREVS